MLRGEGIARPIADTGLFPPRGRRRCSASVRRRARSTPSSTPTADYYEGELDVQAQAAHHLFEPVVIVVMGVIVGFVAIALVSAMYGIFNQVKV